MTQKKRPMNGGGPAFSSAAKEEEYMDEEEDEDENNFGVLLITTHGDYPDPELTTFKPKQHIKKITPEPFGKCVYLNKDDANTISHNIKIIIKQTDIDSISNDLMIMLQDVDISVEKKMREAGERVTTRTRRSGVTITHITPEDNLVDKYYIVYPTERVAIDSPYFDSITLLTELTHNDLLQKIKGRTTREEIQFIKLSEILEYLFYQHRITKLIIVDLTCSEINPTRYNRRITRSGDTTAGGKLKKLKQTNNKKLRNTKTKRKKTRKMRRRLNK